MHRDQSDNAGQTPAAGSGRVGAAPRGLPEGAASDARWLIVTRALRALADGAVSILLVTYLQRIGFSAFQVGAIVTGTLLGSAALTLAVGVHPELPQRLRWVVLSSADDLLRATPNRAPAPRYSGN